MATFLASQSVHQREMNELLPKRMDETAWQNFTRIRLSIRISIKACGKCCMALLAQMKAHEGAISKTQPRLTVYKQSILFYSGNLTVAVYTATGTKT